MIWSTVPRLRLRRIFKKDNTRHEIFPPLIANRAAMFSILGQYEGRVLLYSRPPSATHYTTPNPAGKSCVEVKTHIPLSSPLCYVRAATVIDQVAPTATVRWPWMRTVGHQQTTSSQGRRQLHRLCTWRKKERLLDE